ncbi:MAG: Ada metal-binding domain-containing protein [Phycisphaerae bacterium]|nr:Ada metal-binding domain-containing protein [Phycisphaerae bacterium]MDD5380745.1 Ada metal-binding domain-containing protein [Phycisphaerae bacterium]
MKTGKCYLSLAIILGILCVPALGEVEPASRGELPPAENKPMLIAQPNPTLAGVRKLYIVILPPDAEPNKDGLVWANLEAAVNNKISKAGIKVAEAIQREHVLRSLAIPELRIEINMLKIEESNQYIFHIETSLAKKVYLTKDVSRSIKADLWKTEPTMRAVSEEDMPAAVTSAVSEQVEAFIHAYTAANPFNKRYSGSNANDISEAAEEQAEPAAESTPASQRDEPTEYKYAASKNSNIFHKSGCAWIKRIKPENLVYYSSRDEATSAGKKPCKLCNP